MNLSELEELLSKSPSSIRQLFVKAINIYADPMQNAEDDAQKQDTLKAAIEATAKLSKPC